MSETLVEDGTTYPSTITVPEDGDARNAASVVVGFQGLANRFKHFWTKFADAIINGGTITLSGSGLTINCAAADMTVTGGDLQFSAFGNLKPNGRIRSHCFEAGTFGRPNRRVAAALTPATSSTTDIDPTLHDRVRVQPPSGTCAVRIAPTPSGAYVPGDHITVINSSIYTVDIKNPAGTVILQLLVAGSWGEIYLDDDGTTWRVGPYKDS